MLAEPIFFIPPMFACFIGSLRAVASILVPCGLLATLVLPRAHGEVARGESPQGPRHPSMLVAEGLPFVIIRPSGRIAMASRSARRLFALRSGTGGNLLSLSAGTEAYDAFRRALHFPFERTEYFRVAFPGSDGVPRLYRMESTPMAEGNATGIVLREVMPSAEVGAQGLDSRVAEAATSMAGPLSVLSGWLEVANEPGATLSPAALRAMERQVVRLRELSEELSGELVNSPLLLGSIDLVAVVQRAADCLVARLLESGSRLELSYSQMPFLLRGDASLWRQIVGELLGSALHGAESRQLRLRAEYCGEQAVVDIASDGPAFWDATPEGCRSRLELVQALVRAQNGELECELGSPYATRYRLTFPLV